MTHDDDSRAAWNTFVASSPAGTIFHKTYWLDAWGGKYDILGIYEGSTLMGGFAAPYRAFSSQKTVATPSFAPYSGLIYREADGKTVTRTSKEKDVSATLAASLKKYYRWGTVSFHHAVTDLQPFIWDGFDVYIGYTYILDISDLDKTLRNMSRQRTQNIKKAASSGLKVKTSATFDEIVPLIKETYKTQGIDFPESLVRRYEKELSKRNTCRSFLCTDNADNPLAAYFLVWDEKRAYTLLAGHYPEKGNAFAGPFCFWEAVKFASCELGLKELDHAGSMIPRVERFVRDFGGRITPYYGVRWGNGLGLMTRVYKLLRRCL
jgi:lipid II:glycine glycyltransferase (peptidoglycan interpeptide bridge formation enzyme)